MIKKINILLILIASIIGVYFAITRDKELVFILKDISIILTISALYIIQKLFKIKINDKIVFIYIVFIFMAHFLGSIVDLYSKIYWYDKFIHFLCGIVCSFLAIYILSTLKQNKNTLFNILFILSFTMFISSSWEIFEYISSILLNVDPQKVVETGINDTMIDIIVSLLGSILVSVCYLFEHKYNYNMLIKKYEKLV